MWTGNNPRAEQAVCRDARARAEAGGSLFLRIARFCDEQTLTLQEMRTLVGRGWLKRSCFELTARAGARLGCALKMTDQDWRIVQARELLPKGQDRVLIVTQLRYCPRCLATGWHSGLFQHVAVRTCPQHGTPLVTGCRHCGAAIDTAPIALAEHHLYCPDCGGALVGRPIGPLQTDTAKYEALRLALSPPARIGIVTWPAGHTAQGILRSPAESNAAAAHYAWNRQPVAGLRSFAHVQMALPDLEQDDALPHRRLLFESTLGALNWIRDCVASECGAQVLGTCTRRLRSTERLTGVSVPLPVFALWQLTLALNVPRYLDEKPVELHRSWEYPARRWLPNWIEVWQRSIEAHALALYTVNLLQARRYSPVRGIAFSAAPILDAARVSPAWWVEGQEAAATWILRSRIERQGARRLMHRYRKRFVTSVL